MKSFALRQRSAPPRRPRAVAQTFSTVSHRRLSHRVCMLVLVLALLPALLLSLAGCGGGGGGTAETTPPAPEGRAQTLQASAPGELLAYVKERIRARAGVLASDPNADVNGPAGAPPLLFSQGPSATAGAAVVSAAPTQEPGVEEPDLIKSDGQLVLSLHPDARTNGAITPRLRSHRRQADGSLVAVSSWTATATAGTSRVSRGLLVADGLRRAAVLGESISFSGGSLCPQTAPASPRCPLPRSPTARSRSSS
jgi:hypothetical protein